jgi:hypothetical protein
MKRIRNEIVGAARTRAGDDMPIVSSDARRRRSGVQPPNLAGTTHDPGVAYVRPRMISELAT